jgi:nuclear control of ATPase protein 2
LLVTLEQTPDVDLEETVLKKVILDKLVVGLYAHALDIYLLEAIEVETEAEWWADIEHSPPSVMLYLLQSKSRVSLHLCVT